MKGYGILHIITGNIIAIYFDPARVWNSLSEAIRNWYMCENNWDSYLYISLSEAMRDRAGSLDCINLPLIVPKRYKKVLEDLIIMPPFLEDLKYNLSYLPTSDEFQIVEVEGKDVSVIYRKLPKA